MRRSVGGTAALIATAMLLVLLAIAEVAFADFRTVTRVVDGDTLVLDDGEKLRLIGVDTPETKDPRRPVQYFGREATNFTKQFVEGKKVRVEFDPANSATAHKDKYGRTLGYVFREDGKFLNAEIIRQGFGHAYTRYPFKHASEFRALEQQARERNVGLWNDASTGAARAPNAAAVSTEELSAKTVYIGPRGGRYQYSASGTKVYQSQRLR